jgi:hypothetical protein
VVRAPAGVTGGKEARPELIPSRDPKRAPLPLSCRCRVCGRGKVKTEPTSLPRFCLHSNLYEGATLRCRSL